MGEVHLDNKEPVQWPHDETKQDAAKAALCDYYSGCSLYIEKLPVEGPKQAAYAAQATVGRNHESRNHLQHGSTHIQCFRSCIRSAPGRTLGPC